MAKLNQLLQEIRTELGGDFISTDIVGSDGMSIAGTSADASYDSAAASARFAMIMKLASKVSDKLSLGGVDDNMATTDQAIILSRFLGDGSYFWVLAIPKDATLGSVRMIMNEYTDQIWNAIPH
jgi:predicted regulator of Ras-like GTPase activity (Roadblock/LC7/MglB family)